LGIGLVVATLFLAVATFRRQSEVAVAVGWITVALLPVSNLLVVTEIVLAERTLYLPSIGVSILAAVGVFAARDGLRRWLIPGFALWLAGASFVTVTRNPVWRDTDTVFQGLLEQHPESARVLWWLGQRNAQAGDWERAKQWFYRSLEVWPHQAQYLAEFALELQEHGELAEAERMIDRSVALMPGYADNHILLCVIRLQLGDPQGVLEAASRARKAIGESPLLDWLRADALEQLGEYAAAASAVETSMRNKGSATWQDWLRLARLRTAAGDAAAALSALDSATLLPGSEPARIDSLRALIGQAP
jgi:tetratricopeptide (TPR) repeat protein